MAMARRTWSVATGLARDTLGENLTCPTPSKDCFFGLVSYVVSYVFFGCFYLPPERFRTVQTENERFRGIPPDKGMKNLRKNSRNNPCKGFWTVQNGEWTVQGYSPLKKAWKTYVRTHVRTHVTTHVKVSEGFRTVQNGEWTVQGYSPLKKAWWASIMGLFWLVMGHVFHMISYVDCDMDSYMPGGGGMLTTDIEASRWSNIYMGLWWPPAAT